MILGRPDVSEYNVRYSRYIDLVPESDLCAAMSQQIEETKAFVGGIPESMADFRYATGKWTIREVVGHVLDTERIFGYRLLCIARGDTAKLEGADQDLYVRNASFNRFKIEELLEEFALVRGSNVILIRHLLAEAWDRVGSVSGNSISVRAIGYLMVGHERHHLGIIQSKYLQQSA